ncbi:MAG TPA: PIF1 family DEAD/DEAH box helicase [Candidatus Paceibacterota bacterium]|nr:PIF1 family DEAD/DEAH box helicase [Candidatus Paceibacterota bacterium]
MLQSTALAILKTGENVFLTGAPGAGKTYLLNEYIRFLEDHEVEVAVTAYTGIAASHLSGRTLHSWAGLTRGPIPDEKQERDRVRANEYLTDRIRRARVLIIDEISMLHPEQFDRVDLICRTARNSSEPFGGLQIVCCGDFFQIPPVNGESEKFVIDSAAWKNAQMRVCYLTEQHRQVGGSAAGRGSSSGDDLLEILDAIRAGEVTPDITAKLNARIGATVAAPIGIARLYTHRENVDEINAAELRKLATPDVIYEAYTNGPAVLVDKLKKDNDVPDKLTLKIGARVMFTKNNMGVGYVNGTLGEVVDFEMGGDGDSASASGAAASAIEANPVIMTFDKKRITLGRFQWRVGDSDGGRGKDGKSRDRMASVSQLPLKLAWAITIHKSQGMTLDAAVIDLGRAFDRGMGYVALSRVRELRNISLIGFNALALQVSPRVRALDAGFRADSARTEQYLASFGEDELRAAQGDFIRRAGEESGGAGGVAPGALGGHNTAGTVFDDLRIDYTDIDEMPVADF